MTRPGTDSSLVPARGPSVGYTDAAWFAAPLTHNPVLGSLTSRRCRGHHTPGPQVIPHPHAFCQWGRWEGSRGLQKQLWEVRGARFGGGGGKGVRKLSCQGVGGLCEHECVRWPLTFGKIL